MTLHCRLKQNTYVDSVTLMRISTAANDIEGVKQAQIAMGTQMNKAVLKDAGLFSTELEAATNADLMIAILTEENIDVSSLFEHIEGLFVRKAVQCNEEKECHYHTLVAANENIPESNLVIISVNGIYAVREARRALSLNKHVMLFSDNIAIEDELSLKQLAHEKGLLLMGPDCGTAIINGVGLGFANNVRRGNIGIVAASGTGAQEVAVRVHEFGGGISQLIGTGGRDLSEHIGGIMMLDGLTMLAEDPETEVIIIVSKPPAQSVVKKIFAAASHINKPIFVWFLGYHPNQEIPNHINIFPHSKPAAMAAVIASGVPEESINKHALNLPLIAEIQAKLCPEQRYIRGLFCGGTLCDEALFIASEFYTEVYSNIHPNPEYRLSYNAQSKGHTFIDFGDDQFTNGKAHPMIDPTYRIERILKEGRDPETGVLLLDFVLGFGADADPVGKTLEVLKTVKAEANEQGRHLEILAYVLGTDLDSPSAAEQVSKLEDIGVTIASSSTNAGLLARGFVFKGE